MNRTLGFVRDVVQNRRRQTTLPRYMTYIVTWTCNARCVMCDCWKKDSPDDLSLEEIENIFRQLPRMDAVRLTGGEPFVRPDFGEIARLTEDILQPRFLHVTTNGFLTKRIVEFCEKRARTTPLRVLISLDGLEEKHNAVRGRETAWATASATVAALAPRQKELNLELSINQTIVDADGVEHYRKLRDWLKPQNVRLNVVMAYDASATYSLKLDAAIAQSQIGKFTTFGGLTPELVGQLADEIDQDVDGFPWADRVAKRYYWEGVRSRVVNQDKVPSPNPPCVALGSHIRLFPNGDVPVCQFNTRRAGNLRNETFEELWESETTRKERNWVRKCPGCWAECEVLPSAVYTGDLMRAVLR